MRRIVLNGRDRSLFDHEVVEGDVEYFASHKDTFKQMWKDQGKSFRQKFVISFRWYTTHHGVLAEFPGTKETFDNIMDKAFIYIHEVFTSGTESTALNLLTDTFELMSFRGAIKHLEAKKIAKDPFYAKDSRTVFRKLFGEPSDKKSYFNVYFLFPLYAKFGSSLVQCLRRWVEAPTMDPEDESYWTPPQAPDPVRERPAEPAADGNVLKAEPMPKDGVGKDFTAYLAENLKGDPYGPCFLKGWEFGDPRFVDPANPLYQTSANPTSDWRDTLNFVKFKKFFWYVHQRYHSDDEKDAFPDVYRLYHSEIMTYPPPANRRIYNEVERSFLQSSEKHYKLGLSVPTDKMEDLQANDMFIIGTLSAKGEYTFVGKEKDKKRESPVPTAWPSLAKGSRLMVMRRHADECGTFEEIHCDDIILLTKDFDTVKLATDVPATNITSAKSTLEDDEDKENQSNPLQSKTNKLSSDLGAPKKKDDKPAINGAKTAGSGDSKGESMSNGSPTDVKPKPSSSTQTDVKVPPKSAAKADPPADGESAEDSITTDTNEDDPFWMRPRKRPGPDYPTCMEEMKIVPMEDIDPTVAGLFQLMAAQVGDIDIFHFARRKATLPIPDCRDEFTYGHITGYTEKQTIDTMAVTLQKEWRKARRKRKRDKRSRMEKKRVIRQEVDRRREERRRERESQSQGATANAKPAAGAACAKAKPAKAKQVQDINSLKICRTCEAEEPEMHTYKKCQRCKQEDVADPRYYCGRDCQVMDWKLKHKDEHKNNVL